MSCRALRVGSLIVLSAWTQLSAQEVTRTEPDFGKFADGYFQTLLADNRIRAAGVIVVNTDSPALTKVYGPVNMDHSLWRGASVSKALTAIAIMQLVEQSKINLDADVNQYLNSFQIPATYNAPVTLRQLLEFRSGVDERFIGDGFVRGDQPSMVEMMKLQPPIRVYAPNEIEFYSNHSYALVGAIIEQVTGERFETYVQQSVLYPLGMNHSTFQQPLPPSLLPLKVPGKWWYQHAAPAGGLTTTAADMEKFLIATTHEGAGVLSKSSFETMTKQNARSGIVHRLGYWAGNDQGVQVVGASGDLGDFHIMMASFPVQRAGFVVLVSGKNVASGFYKRFLEASFGQPHSEIYPASGFLRPQPDDYKLCARFTGLYRTVRYPHHEVAKTFIVLDLTRVTLERDGALRIHGSRWVNSGRLQFTKEDRSQTISFVEDSGSIRFMDDSLGKVNVPLERIAWYESEYPNIGFYLFFTMFFAFASWRAKGMLQWLCLLALVHSLGWLSIVLIVGPSNLMLGMPLALKSILSIGTILPLMVVLGIYSAWRNVTKFHIACAVALACYIPFVWYWNLRL